MLEGPQELGQPSGARHLAKHDEGIAHHEPFRGFQGFQERGLGLVNLLARHGLAVVEDVGQRIDPFARGHQVIYL